MRRLPAKAWLIVGLFLIAGIIGGYWLVMLSKYDAKATEENAEMIEIEMSPEQVKTILGKPRRIGPPGRPGFRDAVTSYFYVGRSQDGLELDIEIAFGTDNRVRWKESKTAYLPTIMDRIREMLGL